MTASERITAAVLVALLLAGAAWAVHHYTRPTAADVMVAACVDLVESAIPTAPTFELLEGRANLRTGTVVLRYARQNLHGATIAEDADCRFELASEGPLYLLDAAIGLHSYSDVLVSNWNVINRVSQDGWTWPETP